MEPFVREAFSFTLAPSSRIDREKGIVYGVRAVNVESRNDNVYPASVLARDSKVYEGAASFWGHRKNPQDFDDPTPKFGKLTNVRPTSGGLEADLQFNPKHPQAEAFLWACEHNPSLYALSHHARVRWAKQRDGKGRRVAEAILEVASVDVVAAGGTTSSVFESLSDIGNNLPAMNPKDPQTIATIVAGLPDPTALGDFLTALFDALPSGMFGPSAKMDVLATFMDKLDNAATPESLKRRGKVGQWAAERLEGFEVKEALATRTAKARDLIAAASLPASAVTELFVETVTESLASKGEDFAKALISDRRAIAGAGPRSSPPGTGTTTDAKARAAAFSPN